MNAAVYHGHGELTLQTREPAPVGPHDVRVRVEAAGICGTDLHIRKDEYDSAPPVVLGHEFAGRIVEAGDAVAHVAVGDLVTVEPHVYCGICKFCADGQEHRCTHKQAFGVHLDGGFAEQVTVPARNAYRLPAGMTAAIGALAEPLGCVLHGIDRAEIRAGADVAVFGAGPIGLLLLTMASRAGAATVIAVEPNPDRRALARRFGATLALAPDEAGDAIRDATDGYGADVVFEATGLPAVFTAALASVSRGGRLVVFGVAAPSARVELSPFHLYREELTLVGSLTNPYAHRRAVRMLPSLGLEPLITHTFPLSEIHAAFRTAEEGEGLKVHIAPNA